MVRSGSVENYKSIVTLVIFLLTNINVVFPLRIPFIIPGFIIHHVRTLLSVVRIVPKNQPNEAPRRKSLKLIIPLDFSTVPVIAVLFLLAIKAIGGQEVRGGIVGANGIHPIDIMALFISLAYICISLDATGLLRFLAFWVLKKGGSRGRLLYFLLYIFFFTSGVIVGNDPVILSGTAFLVYMTRVAGILDPTAWIYAQFAAANISSTVLVSSNPTNLVLTGAFGLSFIEYTANVVVPVVITATILFPLLLYVLFPSSSLIPRSIDISGDDSENQTDGPPDLRYALIDKSGAIFGCILLAITLGTLLATSATGVHVGVYAITVPAAVLMLFRDVAHDLRHRRARVSKVSAPETASNSLAHDVAQQDVGFRQGHDDVTPESIPRVAKETISASGSTRNVASTADLRRSTSHTYPPDHVLQSEIQGQPSVDFLTLTDGAVSCFTSLLPTVTLVLSRLPLTLLPFAFSMFILVQGLGSKGWVEVFAEWWAAWVVKTGTVGAVSGMGFVSVCLCNFAGTNIGATILLARILQLWNEAHSPSVRTRDGAIFALALGSNYGAFSTVFSASLAGLLWRDILRRKLIYVRRRDFARINLPLIAIAMSVGCGVLTAQVYLVK